MARRSPLAQPLPWRSPWPRAGSFGFSAVAPVTSRGPDLLGTEGPEAPSPRVGTWLPETAEGRALGPPRLQPCPPRRKRLQPGRGQGVRWEPGTPLHFPAFLVQGACLFITPMPTYSHFCTGGLVSMAENPQPAAANPL